MNEDIIVNVFESHNGTERVPQERKRNNSMPNNMSFKNKKEIKMFSEKQKHNLSWTELSTNGKCCKKTIPDGSTEPQEEVRASQMLNIVIKNK